MLLISRRRHAFGGERYIKSQGLDEYGNSSNFIESELIIYNSKSVLSYVSIRGGLPGLWKYREDKKKFVIK